MKPQLRNLNSFWTVRSTRTHDDLYSLRYALYQSGKVKPEKYVVYLNGRTEWIEKNMELPELLQLPDNCGFLAIDHRGQGASGGPRSYVHSYDDYALDAQRVISEALEHKPYVILAHSMGGLIAIYGTEKGIFTPFSMALSSPLLKLVERPLPNYLARPVSSLLSLVGCGQQGSGAGNTNKKEFASNVLTHDPDAYSLACNSPYRVPSATFGWIKATFEALDYVHKPEGVARLSAPTLVMTPSEEAVVDPRGQIAWVKQASIHSKVDVQRMTIHGARHELFSEIPAIRDRAVAAARAWFKSFLD